MPGTAFPRTGWSSQPIGCDLNSFRPLPRTDPKVRAVRQTLGVADDEKLILTIGGDGASKGSQEMMAALAKIDAEYPKWRYVCKVWSQQRTEKQNKLDLATSGRTGDSSQGFLRGRRAVPGVHALSLQCL